MGRKSKPCAAAVRAAVWALAILGCAAIADGIATSRSRLNLHRSSTVSSPKRVGPSKAFWTLKVAPPLSGGDQLQHGEALAVVGSLDELGAWDVDAAIPMHEGQDGTWTVSLQLPAGATARYKYLILRDARSEDAIDGERRLVLSSARKHRVLELFNAPSPRAIITSGGGAARVRFCVAVPGLTPEESVLLCGEPMALGGWLPDEAVRMKRVEGSADEWSAEVVFPEGDTPREVQYKYLVQAAHEWETVGNRPLRPVALTGPPRGCEFFNHVPEDAAAPSLSPPSRSGDDDTALCRFQVELGWGFQGEPLAEHDAVCVVGGTPLLGSWNVHRALPLMRLAGDAPGGMWGTALRLPARDAEGVEYKFAIFRAPRWEMPFADAHRTVAPVPGATTFLRDAFGHLDSPGGLTVPVALEQPREDGPAGGARGRRNLGRIELQVLAGDMPDLGEHEQVGVVGEGGGLLGWDLASAFPMDAERGPGGGKSWVAAMEGDVGEEVRYRFVAMTPPRWESSAVDRVLHTGGASRRYTVQQDMLGVWDGTSPPEQIPGAPSITAAWVRGRGAQPEEFDEQSLYDEEVYDDGEWTDEEWDEHVEDDDSYSRGGWSPEPRDAERAADRAKQLAEKMLRERLERDGLLAPLREEDSAETETGGSASWSNGANSPHYTPDAAGDRVRRMHFVLRTTKRLREGERPYIVGAHEALDSWNPAGGVAMAPITGLHSHEQEWEAVVALTEGDTSEFKFLLRGPHGSSRWEEGGNRYLQAGFGEAGAETVLRETIRLPELSAAEMKAPAPNGAAKHAPPGNGAAHAAAPALHRPDPRHSDWRTVSESTEESSGSLLEVVISSVEPGSPASRVGLRKGDKLLAVGRVDLSAGATHRTSDEIAGEIQTAKGKRLHVLVQRPGVSNAESMSVSLEDGHSPLGCTLALSTPLPA